TAIAKITGTYNGKLLKVQSGSTTYILAMPSILSASGSTTVGDIVEKNELVYNGYKNLPYQYNGNYKTKGETALNLVNAGNILVYSGDVTILSESSSTGTLARKTMLENLQTAYSGSTISSIGEISQLLNTDTNDATQTEYITTYLVKNDLGGSVKVSSSSSSSSSSSTSSSGGPSNSCATQPVYTHTTFTAGTPTSVDQVWQNSSSGDPCYYECTDGYSGSDCSVAPSCATQPVYTNANFTTGTPTSANQSWQNTNGSNPCYYECTNGYTGNDCSLAPAYTACTGTNQIKYQISGVVGTSTTGITCSDYIVICTGVSAGIIMDACNVGATVAGTSTTSYGHYFQWGNKNGFTETPTKLNTQVNAGGNGPSSYDDSTFRYGFTDWSSVENDNLWGDTTSTSVARQGPCDNGFHIPSNTEWGIIRFGYTWSNATDLKNRLLMPWSGDLKYGDGVRQSAGTYGHYWSSTPTAAVGFSYHFNFGSTYLTYNDSTYGERARGYNVRCIKN
ncbi:MAG: hypothetical protein PHS49_08245, partial [Candidatus Gracilibacteria bacterium]|nr:hypothetical protein [Candidatus Gracilibacteria bacterium]